MAGTIAVAISLILRLFAGGLFVPEIASLTLFSLTPGEVESQAVADPWSSGQIFFLHWCYLC